MEWNIGKLSYLRRPKAGKQVPQMKGPWVKSKGENMRKWSGSRDPRFAMDPLGAPGIQHHDFVAVLGTETTVGLQQLMEEGFEGRAW